LQTLKADVSNVLNTLKKSWKKLADIPVDTPATKDEMYEKLSSLVREAEELIVSNESATREQWEAHVTKVKNLKQTHDTVLKTAKRCLEIVDEAVKNKTVNRKKQSDKQGAASRRDPLFVLDYSPCVICMSTLISFMQITVNLH